MKLLFHVVEVTRLLSSIIKGQRVRSESRLEIQDLSKSIAPENKDKDLTIKAEEQKRYIEKKMQIAESEAETMIQKATDEAVAKAALIIKDGHDRIKMESTIALERAQDEGYARGYEKGQLEAQSLIDEAKQVVQNAKEEREQTLDKLEPEIIEMIINICGKLIGEELHYNKETILVLIRKTLESISTDTLDVTIKVSERDYDYVLENKELITGNAAAEKMKVVKDINLVQGSCTIETEFGSISCKVDEAFKKIKKQMRLIASKK